jgi:hypothetical protein
MNVTFGIKRTTSPPLLTRDPISLCNHIRSWAPSQPHRTRRVSRRPGPPISGRPSGCSELKSLFEAYSSLSSSVHRLIVDLPSDLFDPEFSRQFKRFSTAFNIFTHQLSIFISSPGTQPRILFVSSPLYQSGISLVREWKDFIVQTNVLSDGSVAPHLERVSDHFATLNRNMNFAFDLITLNNFRSSAPLSSWNALTPILLRMRDQCDLAFVGDGVSRFDADDFDGQAITACRIVANLFDKQMPRFARAAGDCGHIKAEMAQSLAALGPLMRAAQTFEFMVNEIKTRIQRLNAELSDVHQRFELPFAMPIDVERVNEQPTEQKKSVHDLSEL